MHRHGCAIQLILPDWFYTGVLHGALVLTIDRAYFDLTGRLKRWLFHLVRKHGRLQSGGRNFDFVRLHAKSGSRSELKHLAYDRRQFVRRQTLPGCRLAITRDTDGVEESNFSSLQVRPICRTGAKVRAHLKAGGKPVNCIVLGRTRTFGPLGTGPSYSRGRKSRPRICWAIACRAPSSANPETLGPLLTDHVLSCAIGKATAAKIPQRRLFPFHDNHSAAANVVAAICRNISICSRRPKTSLNKGAVT